VSLDTTNTVAREMWESTGVVGLALVSKIEVVAIGTSVELGVGQVTRIVSGVIVVSIDC
jgi:hypothetical protein